MMAAMATADKERENGGGGEKRSACEDDLKDDEKAKKQLKTVEPKSPSDESKTKTKSAERLLKEGFVPISEKYLVLADDAAAKEPVSASNGSSAPAVCPTVSTSKKPSGHNRSGKSKNRLKKERRERIESKALLCHAFARGDCPFGDKCRWNHDVEAFLSQKEEDLPGKCLFMATVGSCKYGVTCRYYGSHGQDKVEAVSTTDEKESKHLDKMDRDSILSLRMTLPVPETVKPEMNTLDRTLQHRLRKNTEHFPRSDKLLAEMGVKISKHYRNRKQGDEGAGIDKGDAEIARATPRERKKVDFSNKLYLSPLTTVGNLPYRRICKTFGADITCGEMAMATNILQGQASEWALLKRHPSEDFFGVQLAGGFPDSIARASELINRELDVDFIDINMGCPIDLLCNKGGGAALLKKPEKIKTFAKCVSPLLDIPLTLKTRKGYFDGKDIVHNFVHEVSSWGVSAFTLHGRTREQRYTRNADWDYIDKVAAKAGDLQVIGNGDIYNFEEYNRHMKSGNVNTVMIGRAALIKPWIFKEIKEQRHYDISATERLDMLKVYCSNGLEHWGSDARGVETTRKFLLEWQSFLHRYVPVGLMEVIPQTMGMRPPAYYGRSDLETLLASTDVKDWIKISEMFLGPTPKNFSFVPKHKSYSYKVVNTDGATSPPVVQDFGEQNG